MTNENRNVNYVGPFITMVILMSLVGFITVVNQQFQAPMQVAFLKEAGDLKNTLATVITFSFFLAYLLMGGMSAKSLVNNGYRGTLIRGLIILIGAFVVFELSAFQFEQSAGSTITMGSVTIPHAYFIFILGSFIAGTALTFLQSAINPYLVACDVKGTSGVQRQTIAGAGNSTMTTIAPFFVAAVIFQNRTADDIQISSLYVPFAILIVIVAALAYILTRLNLPEIASVTSSKDEKLPRSVWSFSHLALGVVAIFVYVGVEVAVGANIVMYAKDLGGSFAAKATLMASLYWGGMLVGRLLGSFVSKIPANTQLLFTSVAAGVLVVASMLTNNPWLLVGVGLFHSIMWPAIFPLAIEGLGKYTSKASGALMMGVVGGAVFPLLQGIMADSIGSWGWTWIIVALGEVYLLYYALSGHKVKERVD
ncbi:MAG: sugar MFS transporter [Bacteroidales bacterium]|mgnify:CR=1 FL=1|nr:sugar MFS transporter [Bacteroidales bacterium]